jgi:hypothetical protein
MSGDGLERLPLERPPLERRLDRVQQRATYVLLLFVRGSDPDEDGPAHILGPYTRIECERVEQYLACEYRREQINTTVPTWADARIGRG